MIFWEENRLWVQIQVFAYAGFINFGQHLMYFYFFHLNNENFNAPYCCGEKYV